MKRIICLVFCISALFLLGNCGKTQKPSHELAAGFIDPPVEARPRAYLCWVNGNFDKARLTQELEEAKRYGMGGFDIWDVTSVKDDDHVVPAGPAFMSDESVDAIAHTVRQATRLGLDIGLTVSSGWNAGGRWTSPENATMGLYQTEITVNGPKKIAALLPFPDLADKSRHDAPAIIERDLNGLPTYYKNIAVLAYPITGDSILQANQIVDLTNKMSETGKVAWAAPPGKWKIVRYVCANTGQPLFSHSPNSVGPMIDHFSAKATEDHLLYFIEKLEHQLGPLKNTSLRYLYTDSYEVRGLLWTPELIKQFKARIGYDITPFLPVLYGFTIDDQETTNRFLFDYNKLLSDLIIENHYKKGKEVCNRYGIGFVAEAGGPGKPLHNCPFESLKALGSLDIPRGEFWNDYDVIKGAYRTDEQIRLLQVVKGIASAAHLYNQKYVEAEAFTSTWLWQESLADLKPLADRAFCEGLNRFVFHTFAHEPKAAGVPGWLYSFGTVINATQTWWHKSRAFMDYLARCSYLLQQGDFVADALYYYGDTAPNFAEPKQIKPDLGFGYDYDYVNSDIILNKLSVQDGKLVLPHGQSYRVLVLPPSNRIDLAVLQKLEQLVQDGAIIISPRPVYYHGLNDYKTKEKQIAEIATRMWGKCDGNQIRENSFGKGKVVWGKTVRQILKELKILPDFMFAGNIDSTGIDFIHRQTVTADIYFVRNVARYQVNIDGIFKVRGKKPQLWNALTGEMIDVSLFAAEGEYTQIPLHFEQGGSVFIVFEGEIKESHPSSLKLDAKTIFPLTDGNAQQVLIYSNSPYGLLFFKSGAYIIGTNSRKIDIPESVELSGDWEVAFPEGWGAPKEVTFKQLASWHQSEIEGVKYFSGTATYKKNFEITKERLNKETRIFLNLNNVAVVADVYVNGKSAGILWTQPFKTDITELVKAGNNELKIEVANRWTNRLIGDAKLPPEKRLTRTNVRRLPNTWSYPMADLPSPEFEGLLPSGLLGPVYLEFAIVAN